MSTPLLLGYRALSAVLLPFMARSRVKRLRKSGVPLDRAHEVLGHPSQQRPLGPVVWIHVASVGEAKSALPLLAALQAQHPDLRAVLTSFTPTSADVLAKRLPDSAVHQFAPLDGMGPIKRFLRHWRPDLGIFIESEVWPNLITATARAEVPLALINARLSERSIKRWQKAQGTARAIFGRFGLIHCQDRGTADALYAIGLRHARLGVNLKSIISAPQFDELELARLRSSIGERPIWSAVSTHPGEEEIVIEAHRQLRLHHPKALLVLVPRHPERAENVKRLCANHLLVQRSRNETPDTDTSIYLADTMGETDLWFRLAPFCCLCGSFSDVGGHTPYEPAAAGATLLHGPHYANHADAYAKLHAAGASIEVQDAETLCAALDLLLRNPIEAHALAQAAKPLATAGQDAAKRLARECLALAGLKEMTDA